MPELPEVQTIVDDLRKKIRGLKITKVEIRLPKIIKSSVKDFSKNLLEDSFKNIRRRAKFLIFELAYEEKFLVIHLRMTGQLILKSKAGLTTGGHSKDTEFRKLPNKHTHLIIYFDDNSILFYNDIRQFGTVQLVNKVELCEILNRFGVEPLENKFTLKKFKELVRNKKGNVKAFLLNQKYIAGIGNIYADEILFEAGVNPKRIVCSLSKEDIENIFKVIKNILRKAIKARGTTFNNYVDADGKSGNFLKFLKVYGRDGQNCKKCDSIIKKIKIAGRGTRYCPKCQK